MRGDDIALASCTRPENAMHSKDHSTPEQPLPITPAGRAAQKTKTRARHVPGWDMKADATPVASDDQEVQPC